MTPAISTHETCRLLPFNPHHMPSAVPVREDHEPDDSESLARTVDRLARQVAALTETVLRHMDEAHGTARPRLLSVREAAKRLGVSASNTLRPAIRAGCVRTVTLPGTRRSVRIPSDEVERIGREGLAPPVRALARIPRTAPQGATLAADIARLAA